MADSAGARDGRESARTQRGLSEEQAACVNGMRLMDICKFCNGPVRAAVPGVQTRVQ